MGIPKSEFEKMPYGEYCDLVSCYKIEEGVMKLSSDDDEEMFPRDLE